MTLIDVFNVFGWVGAVMGILAYLMVSRGTWGGATYAYQLTNLTAASLMALVAAVNGVWPSATANAAWVLIGVHSTVTIARKRAAARAEERSVVDAAVATLATASAAEVPAPAPAAAQLILEPAL